MINDIRRNTQAVAPYNWGVWALRIHIALMLLLLINTAMHYYQADILDNWLQGKNVSATAAELFGMRPVVLAFGGLQLIVMVGLHFWMWWYANLLLRSQEIRLSSASWWWVLLQPVYGLIRWYHKTESIQANRQNRYLRGAGFLYRLWAGVMSAVIAYCILFLLWVLQTDLVVSKAEVATQVYYHFGLTVVNFFFLGVAVYGWRTIFTLQQRHVALYEKTS